MLRDFTKEHFDILIQAGQSNAGGAGIGQAVNPYVPNDKVWYFNQNDTLSQAEEKVHKNQVLSNFVLSFAREYLNKGLLEENRKLLIINAGVGATGFSTHRWGMTDDLYLHMMDMTRTALTLNKENRLVGFLWHQGETDAKAQVSYEAHYKNLMKLVRSVRSEFQVPELPFIAGDFTQQWRKEEPTTTKPIVDAIRAVCNDCGYGRFVETKGLNSNPEEAIHFSRQALYELGIRYFNEFLSIRDES